MDRRKKNLHFVFILHFPPIYPSSIIIHHSIIAISRIIIFPPPPYISEYSYVRKKEACFKKNVNILIDGSIIFDLIDTR